MTIENPNIIDKHVAKVCPTASYSGWSRWNGMGWIGSGWNGSGWNGREGNETTELLLKRMLRAAGSARETALLGGSSATNAVIAALGSRAPQGFHLLREKGVRHERRD